jgi:hypothetical protein
MVMRAADYLKEKQRMCHSMECYSECPFHGDCRLTENDDPERAEELVEEWSIKNPEITNAIKFKEVFGESAEEVWSLLLPGFNMWLNQKYKGNEVK